MVKKNVTLVKPQSNILVRPDFMDEDKKTGLESVQEFVSPPRLKIVQKSADDTLKDKFSEGDIFVTPFMQAIYEPARDDKGRIIEEDIIPFRFTPIFFFPEWCCINPYALRAQLQFIRERSTDPNSEVARKARNRATWSEPCPDDTAHDMRYSEHLNFLVKLEEHPDPICVTFARSEHSTGRKLCNLIKMRNAPIFGNVFQATLGHRSNALGDWWGLDIENPAEDPWVDQELYPVYKTAYEACKEQHESGQIRVDYEDEKPMEETETRF